MTQKYILFIMKKLLTLLLFIVSICSCYSQGVTSSQKLPKAFTAGQSYIIETTINKGTSKSFLMFAQYLPADYKATEIDNKNGSLKVFDTIVKFTWIVPPSQSTFTFTYQLAVPKNATKECIIGGSLFYVLDSVKKEFKLDDKTIKVEAAEPSPVLAKTVAVNKEPVVSPLEKSSNKKEKSSHLSRGKTYRVQIGAYKTKPDLRGVSDLSSVEFDGGVTKYYSGDFALEKKLINIKKN